MSNPPTPSPTPLEDEMKSPWDDTFPEGLEPPPTCAHGFLDPERLCNSADPTRDHVSRPVTGLEPPPLTPQDLSVIRVIVERRQPITINDARGLLASYDALTAQRDGARDANQALIEARYALTERLHTVERENEEMAAKLADLRYEGKA